MTAAISAATWHAMFALIVVASIVRLRRPRGRYRI